MLLHKPPVAVFLLRVWAPLTQEERTFRKPPPFWRKNMPSAETFPENVLQAAKRACNFQASPRWDISVGTACEHVIRTFVSTFPRWDISVGTACENSCHHLFLLFSQVGHQCRHCL